MGIFDWLFRKRKESAATTESIRNTLVDDAIAKLSDASTEARVEVSMALLKSSDSEVRAAVASEVARLEIRAVGAWYELANALADDYESVRGASAKAFWQLNGVDYAIRSLRDEHRAPTHMSKSDALRGINVLRETCDDQLFFKKLIEENWSDYPQMSSLKDIKNEKAVNTNLVAESKPDIEKPLDIIPDDRFITDDDGIVIDTKTTLEWYAGPDKDTDWHEAKSWVENLTVAGGGWRMPTREELETLYFRGAGEHNIMPLLKTTGYWVWSGETKDSSSAWGFAFNLGREYWDSRERSTYFLRGFAVRSRK